MPGCPWPHTDPRDPRKQVLGLFRVSSGSAAVDFAQERTYRRARSGPGSARSAGRRRRLGPRRRTAVPGQSGARSPSGQPSGPRTRKRTEPERRRAVAQPPPWPWARDPCSSTAQVVGTGPLLEHRRTGPASSGGWGRKPPGRAGGAAGAGTRPWPLHPVGAHGDGVDEGPRLAPRSSPRKPPATHPTGPPTPGVAGDLHRPPRQGCAGLGPPLGADRAKRARSSPVGGPAGAAESPSLFRNAPAEPGFTE